MTPEEPRTTGRLPNATRHRLREQLGAGADEVNPDFLFATTHTTVLLAIEAGLIDPVRLARAELAGRGLDADGVWCGFPKSREIHLGLVAADCTDAEAAQIAAAKTARRLLHIDTLDTRNADALDFHELAVWSIREALAAAFEAGAAAPRAEGD